MDTTAIVQRLRDRVSGLREIEAAAGLEAAMRSNLAAPAAYVVPLSESAQPLDSTGDVEQLEVHLFGVIQVVETLDATGAPGVLSLAAMRSQVKAALIGWVPDASNGEPVLFMGGEIVQFAGDGRLWWSDEFTLKSYYRSNP